MTGLLGKSTEGFCSRAPFTHRKLSVWPPWGMNLTGEMQSFGSDDFWFFDLIALWFKFNVSIQVNVICFIWLQLLVAFVFSRGASWIILTILYESQLSFVPLLSFSLWSKQDSHVSSFSRGILVEAFWLAEASRKLLLLAWGISLSKMCVKNLHTVFYWCCRWCHEHPESS